MSLFLRREQGGDTLVEVLVSTVVLTIILAATYTIANRSTRINQTSIERTEVANQLSEQAELLRAMRDTHDGTTTSNWAQIQARAQDPLMLVTVPLSCGDNPTGDGAFYLSTVSGTLGEPANFNRTGDLGTATDAYTSDLFDVWIVAEPSPNDISASSELDDQIDFHIRGCWEGIGDQGAQRSEIISRIRL